MASPGQQQRVIQPKVARRTKMLGVAESPQKTALVKSFEGFNASTVSQKHIDSARKCIDLGGTHKERYMYVPFLEILAQNETHKDYLSMMSSAYDLLLKYVINLLKPKRPQVWRSIKTNNASFKARVACMKGSIDILRKVGYTEEKPEEFSLQFPDHVLEPSKDKLFAIAAELLMAKLEVESLRDPSVLNKLQPELQKYRDSLPQSHSQQQQQQQQQTEYQATFTNYQEVSQPGGNFSQQHMYSGYSQTSDQRFNGSSYSREPRVSFDPSPTEFYQETNDYPPHSQPGNAVQQPPDPNAPVPKPRTTIQKPQLSGNRSPQPVRPRSQEHEKLDSERPSSASSTTSTSSESQESSLGQSGSDPLKSSYKSKLEEFKRRKAAMKAKHEDHSGAQSETISPPSANFTPETNIPSRAVTQPHPVSHAPKLPPKTYQTRGPNPPSLFDNSQIKRPPNKPKPAFFDDTILESEESEPIVHSKPPRTKVAEPVHQPEESQPGTFKYCPQCHCKLPSNAPMCTYCNRFFGDQPQNGDRENRMQPINNFTPTPTPRPPKQNQSKPLRASVDDATQATQQHQIRLTEYQHMAASSTTPFQPYMTGSAYGGGGASGTTGGAYGGGGASGTTGGAYGEGGASGVSSAANAPSESGIELLRKKEEAYKQFQRKKGVLEEDLERLPELVEAERLYSKAQKDKAKQQAIREGKYVEEEQDPNRYERINYISSQDDESNPREQERMSMLKMDGRELLNWIKHCTPNGYTLQEVEIAYNAVRSQQQKTRSPLEYLEQDWLQLTQTVQHWVRAAVVGGNPSVGMPSAKQAREALVKAAGNCDAAVDILYEERKEKINQLRGKFLKMKELRPHVPELKWEDAVKALSANNMDVDAACYAIQCEWLQDLYESIFSDHKGVKQTDMEEIKTLITNNEYNEDTRRRMLMAECNITEMEQADIVFKLIEEAADYPLHYYVDAACDFNDFEAAKKFLNQDCDICVETYPIHDMVTLPGCTDSICRDCFRMHFQVVIKEKGVKHFNCPICEMPDVTDADQEFYFQIFQSQIKQYLDRECYDLCCEKLKDYNLTKEPNFIWCANDTCGNGFIFEGARGFPRDIHCPSCHRGMCVKCKKPWEEQHDGLSCDEFADWKAKMDPDAQAAGLAAHLNANGIECPQCGMKYDLARGGCMHFKCTRCPNEFCSGCGESFKKGKQCGKLESCAKKGLHAHHPRDCLFYMRDFDVGELQQFLQEQNVEFDTEPPKEQVEAARRKKREQEGGEDAEAAEPAEGDEEEKVELHCRVEEQKENPEGLVDEQCGRKVEEGHAGLCLIHYKEYLVNKINNKKLDPVTLYPPEKVAVMLRREELEVPDKNDFDDDEQYKEGLIDAVKGKLPLTFQKKDKNQNPPEGQ